MPFGSAFSLYLNWWMSWSLVFVAEAVCGGLGEVDCVSIRSSDQVQLWCGVHFSPLTLVRWLLLPPGLALSHLVIRDCCDITPLVCLV